MNAVLSYDKGAEPDELRRARSQPDTSYDGLYQEQKDEIRRALVRDQAALCAYCQRRIAAESEDPSRPLPPMKIEHWSPQHPQDDSRRGDDLTWHNLLGVCHGGAPQLMGPADDTTELHCDSRKGNEALFLHPVRGRGGDPERVLQYTASGEVKSGDPRAQQDVSKVLNLNAAKLKRSRSAVFEALRQRMQQKQFAATAMREIYRKHELAPGSLAPEHSPFVRYHLRRWARKQGVEL